MTGRPGLGRPGIRKATGRVSVISTTGPCGASHSTWGLAQPIAGDPSKWEPSQRLFQGSFMPGDDTVWCTGKRRSRPVSTAIPINVSHGTEMRSLLP
jgi:hypothetical protein